MITELPELETLLTILPDKIAHARHLSAAFAKAQKLIELTEAGDFRPTLTEAVAPVLGELNKLRAERQHVVGLLDLIDAAGRNDLPGVADLRDACTAFSAAVDALDIIGGKLVAALRYDPVKAMDPRNN